MSSKRRNRFTWRSFVNTSEFWLRNSFRTFSYREKDFQSERNRFVEPPAWPAGIFKFASLSFCSGSLSCLKTLRTLSQSRKSSQKRNVFRSMFFLLIVVGFNEDINQTLSFSCVVLRQDSVNSTVRRRHVLWTIETKKYSTRNSTIKKTNQNFQNVKITVRPFFRSSDFVFVRCVFQVKFAFSPRDFGLRFSFATTLNLNRFLCVVSNYFWLFEVRRYSICLI